MSKVEVSHFWKEGDGEEMIQSLLTDFERQFPQIDITESSNEVDNHGMMVKTRFLTEEYPNVLIEWPGKNLKPYHDAGVLQPISSVWDDEGWHHSFIDGPTQKASHDGEQYALPLDIHRMNNLFYRPEIVQKAGIDIERVRTPRELIDAIEQLQDVLETPMELHMKDPSSLLQVFANVYIGMHSNRAFQELTENTPRDAVSMVEEALDVVDSLIEYANDDVRFMGMVDANERFVSGDTALFTQGDWMCGDYADRDHLEYTENWDMTTFPGTDGVYMMGVDSFVVPDGVELDDNVRSFLSFMGSRKTQRKLNEMKGAIPPRNDVDVSTFPQYLQEQYRDFKRATEFPAGHALQVTPSIFVDTKLAMAEFTKNRDTRATAQDLVNAYKKYTSDDTVTSRTNGQSVI